LDLDLGSRSKRIVPDLPNVQAAIRAAASSLRLSDWTLDGVHVWPIARSNIYGVISQNLSHRLGQVPPVDISKVPAKNENHINYNDKKPPHLFRLPNAVLFDESLHPRSPPIIFHQLPQDYEGGATDRLADPLVEFLGTKTPITKLCRFCPAVATHKPAISPLNYRFTGSNSASRIPPTEIQGFLKTADRLISWMKKHWFDLGETPIDLLRQTLKIIDRARGAEDILRHLEPQLLMVHRYHDQYQIPFVIAARKLGITSVDIQHGYADSCTPSNDFLEAPPKGFVGVPDIFWVWNKGTAKRLEASFPPDRERPRILVGGAPWTIQDKLVKRSGPLKKSSQRNVLFAHQPDTVLAAKEGELLPGALLDAILQSPETLKWFIRLHPTMRRLIPEAKAVFDSRGLVGKVDVTYASTAPWPELAEQVDVVVTGYSALALEARAFGIPVIVLGGTGAKVFAPILEEANIVVSETSDQLLAAIWTSLSQPAASWSFTDPNPADRAHEAVDICLKMTTSAIHDDF
jgi:hypothetical protein